jgi:hypothetical protein
MENKTILVVVDMQDHFEASKKKRTLIEVITPTTKVEGFYR